MPLLLLSLLLILKSFLIRKLSTYPHPLSNNLILQESQMDPNDVIKRGMGAINLELDGLINL